MCILIRGRIFLYHQFRFSCCYNLCFNGFCNWIRRRNGGLVLGVLRLPLIILGLDPTSANVAVGTNIGVSTFGAITAAIRHFQQNNIYLRTFMVMALTGSIGGFLGSLLTKDVPVTILFTAIAAIVLYEAFAIIRAAKKENKKDHSIRLVNNINGNLEYMPNKRFIYTESVIGFGIGFLGGLVGLILGSIRLPAMISILKMEPKVAIGTNLATSSLMCVSSLAGHLLNGNVDFLIMITMGPAAMIGGYLGAMFTNKVSEKHLKLIIGIVFIIVAGIMIWQIFYQFI